MRVDLCKEPSIGWKLAGQKRGAVRGKGENTERRSCKPCFSLCSACSDKKPAAKMQAHYTSSVNVSSIGNKGPVCA